LAADNENPYLISNGKTGTLASRPERLNVLFRENGKFHEKTAGGV
jgi:hypothetical protein